MKSVGGWRLVDAKEARQREEARRKIEEDAKKLANRVALLRISELKTLKKIKETEKQANRLERLKVANERDFVKKLKQ